MQLGHENSNHLRPLAGPRLSDQALRGHLKKEDPRSSQLDLRISGESRLMWSLKTLILRAADCDATILTQVSPAQEKNLLRARFTTSVNDNENHSWRSIAAPLPNH